MFPFASLNCNREYQYLVLTAGMVATTLSGSSSIVRTLRVPAQQVPVSKLLVVAGEDGGDIMQSVTSFMPLTIIVNILYLE